MTTTAEQPTGKPFDATTATEEETRRFLAETQDAIYTAAAAYGLTHILDQAAA